MDTIEKELTYKEGDGVLSADKESLGKIDHLTDDAIVIKKGLLFGVDAVIPRSAVTEFDGKLVHVSLTKEQATAGGPATSVGSGDRPVPTGDMVGDDPGFLEGAGSQAASPQAGGVSPSSSEKPFDAPRNAGHPAKVDPNPDLQ